MIKIDAFGKACPIPVILIKNEIENDKFDYQDIEIKVDNYVAVQNINKLSKLYNIDMNYEEIDGGYSIILKSSSIDKDELKQDVDINSFVQNKVSYLIASETLGKGSDELGQNLMQMVLYSLTQLENTPSTIAMMNSGVKLATLNDETVESLKELEKRGVRILVCGACLNYYKLTEELKVGEVSNAFEIMSSLQTGTVINL